MPIDEYIPVPWVNGTAPAIDSTNLGHIEVGIKTVTDQVNFIEDGTVPVGRALIADELASGATVPGTVPIGSMMLWAAESPPPDWEVCRGQDMSTATYADLFAVIGTTFGSNSPGVFSLPETRGQFIRGYDSANLNDPEVGRTFGSNQDDLVGPHNHSYQNWKTVGGGAYDTGGANNGALGAATTSNNSGVETRPTNIALTYIIRVL